MAANPIDNTAEVERPREAANDPVAMSVRRPIPLGPLDVAAEPPWPELPPHQPVEWQAFMRVAGTLEAHIILVPLALVHRARWVLAWPEVSEEELRFLATGQI